MKRKCTFALLTFLLCGLSINVSAQCKGFTKKNCLPDLRPYLSNGQISSAEMAPGEEAELQMSFQEGLDYRLLSCADEYLGEMQIAIFDGDKELFRDELKDQTSYWDFTVASTRILTVKLEIPPHETPNEIVRYGCVTVMLGFKEPETKTVANEE